MSGRQCGSCNMCCKVILIEELAKPAGLWCANCAIGKGCNIYSQRPKCCAEFSCAWITDEKWGPEWKPDRAKFVLAIDNARNRVIVHADPGQPHAWKRAPYHQTLTKLAQAGLHKGGQVFIQLDGSISLLLPDGEHPVGKLDINSNFDIRVTGRVDGGNFRVTVHKTAR